MTSAPCLPDYNGPKPKNLFTFKLLLPGIVVTMVRKSTSHKARGMFWCQWLLHTFLREGASQGWSRVWTERRSACRQSRKHSSWCPGSMCAGAAAWSREHHRGGEGYQLSRMASQPVSVEHPHNKASQSMVTNVSFILTGLSQKGSPLGQGHSDYSQAGRRVSQLLFLHSLSSLLQQSWCSRRQHTIHTKAGSRGQYLY